MTAEAPFLVKVYSTDSNIHFDIRDKISDAKYINIYLTKTNSLRDIVSLLASSYPILSTRYVSVSMKLLYISSTGKLSSKEISTIFNYKTPKDDLKTLNDFGFIIGDSLSVVINKENSKMDESPKEGSMPFKRTDSNEFRRMNRSDSFESNKRDTWKDNRKDMPYRRYPRDTDDRRYDRRDSHRVERNSQRPAYRIKERDADMYRKDEPMKNEDSVRMDTETKSESAAVISPEVSDTKDGW